MMTTTRSSTGDRQILPMPETSSPGIVFFDGVCGLCNRTVDFILSHDPRGAFLFAPLQGKTAQSRLTDADRQSLASLVLITEQGTYRRSSAVVRILWRLGGLWKLLGGLLWLVPRPLRDLGYRVVARNRYRLFGQTETCRFPTEKERARFLP